MKSFKRGISHGILVMLVINLILPIYSAQAKITPKDPKHSRLITIKKGDTLWDLAGYYYRSPFLWPKFKRYNFFTDPDWIYPGERLAISKGKATQLVDLLQEKVRSLQEAEKKKVAQIKQLENEINRLKQECGDFGELKNLISSKEEELFVMQTELSQIKDENDMLRSAMLELQIKMVENDATINSQLQEIERLNKQRKIVYNANYFLGFAIISTLLAIDTVR